MTLHPALIFAGGLIIILLGAELVLRGASRIAAMLGIPPMIIGVTVVSVGTSMPELAVGVTAVTDGMGSLAVGNIAGTNILNILFIMGLSAAIRPLKLHLASIRLDLPVMIASAIILFIMAVDGVLTRMEGIVLVLASILYAAALVLHSKKESVEIKKEYEEEFGLNSLLKNRSKLTMTINAAILLIGIALSVLGANLLVEGAVSIALGMGVSEAVIGLTIVAIGTSAPELATTMVATYKDERDVAVGNLIGSSISNILVILGLTCIVAPDGIDIGRDVLWIDLPLAAAVAIVCYPVFRSGQMVTRKEGIAFVSAYLIYMLILIFYRT